MRRSVTTWLLAAYGAVGVAVAALAIFVGLNAAEIRATSGEVNETNDALNGLDEVLTLLQDAESGERGYVISGDDRFLVPWGRANAGLGTKLEAIRPLFAGDGQQAARFADLETSAMVALDFLREVINVRQEEGFDAAQALVTSGQGLGRMAGIRDLITVMREAEQDRLAGRLDRQERSQAQLVVLIAAVGALVVAILAGSFVAITRELRTRRRAEQQLLDQNRILDDARGLNAAILDATHEAVMVVAPSGTILRANRQLGEFLATESSTLEGHPSTDLLARIEPLLADPETVLPALSGSANDRQQIIRTDITFLRPVPRQTELVSAPVRSESGEHLGRLYALRDVTRERESERLKSEFVSLVSHEMRTPLTSIKGYIELILDEEAGPIPAGQRDLILIVRENADRLLRLINDLLDVARIEAGQIVVRPEPLDVASVVARVVATMRPQFAGREQVVTNAIPADLPPALGDDVRFVQIVTNLLSNASKYTPPGGRILVSARLEGPLIAIAVTDTGAGLSAVEQEHVFERFFRARNRATRQAAGTGLGLAITRSFVELQGGTISVQSSEGLGSTFTFTVPALTGAIETAAAHLDSGASAIHSSQPPGEEQHRDRARA